MAALAVDSKINWAGLGPRQTNPFVIRNGVQLRVGSILKLTGGQADIQVAALGTCVLGVAVAGGIPGSNPVLDGFNLQSLPIPMIGVGNVSTAAAGNANEVIVEQGSFTWLAVSLTLANGTLLGTVADVGTKVYAPTSNVLDVTNTQTSTDKPLGLLQKFYSSASGVAIYDILVDSYDARSRGN